MTRARSAALVVTARAKVNLFLRVLARRPDGYHDVETLVAPIDLADRLEFRGAVRGDEGGTGPVSLEVRADDSTASALPTASANLVVRAAEALARRAGGGSADVLLHKRVPVGAGLGGGSADAASALLALNELWRCGLGPEALAEVGAEVGSDVPALLSPGPVLARGRGDVVEPCRSPRLHLALVPFDFVVRSADAYRWWDEDGGGTGPSPRPLLDALRDAHDGDLASAEIAPLLFNDLEGPVARRHPVIAHAKDLLLAAGALGAVMTGSGPTLLGVLPPGKGLEPRRESELSAVAGARPMMVRTVPS